jgi:hypothetical protein
VSPAVAPSAAKTFEGERDRILDSPHEETHGEYLARMAAIPYCCPERKRLYVDCRYSSLRLDYDDNSITCFGTRESDGDWEGCCFQINYCCFCGKKLQTLF